MGVAGKSRDFAIRLSEFGVGARRQTLRRRIDDMEKTTQEALLLLRVAKDRREIEGVADLSISPYLPFDRFSKATGKVNRVAAGIVGSGLGEGFLCLAVACLCTGPIEAPFDFNRDALNSVCIDEIYIRFSAEEYLPAVAKDKAAVALVLAAPMLLDVTFEQILDGSCCALSNDIGPSALKFAADLGKDDIATMNQVKIRLGLHQTR